MKKLVSLLLGIVFIGSLMMVGGCAPKQEAAQQAPAMEEAAPVAGENTPSAEQAVPGAEQGAPAAAETPAAE